MQENICSRYSFNEAEALKPRIRARAIVLTSDLFSFNEAEALKPRIPLEIDLANHTTVTLQ